MSATPVLKMETPRDWTAAGVKIAEAVAATAAAHDAEESFVADNFAKLRDAGFLAAPVPAELGGGGIDYRTLCSVIRQIGTRCGSTALTFSMHAHLVATAAWRWKHQQAPTDGLLRRVAAESLVLVSSGGSDWLKSAGTATKVDGGFRIDARKIFSSGCPAGDLLMTSAVYDDPEAGPTVLHFAVPFKAEGVSILDTWYVMGMRGTGSHDVELKGVFVPDAAISGRRPQGTWHPLFHAISMIAFPLIYSAYVGVAEGARDAALTMARSKPANAGLIGLTGEMQTAFWTAETTLAAMIVTAETAMPGPETTNAIMTGRTVAGQAAIRTVELALEVAGGAAFYRSAGIERAFRDVQGARFHPLQGPAQRDLSGRLALGLDIDG
ncbi:acyl-CoA dehydrogenase family protein [Sphingosinicella microcystinivorans]|uniref:acyl-CoA dehydrogenase family protein n=1 Tax=Sphingosinicella microcystinivorans TaxID=335406 RepID=UPI0022F3D545|nr:acyl-CoA dehydrogenase family protein [Sphingosinicella microcystinivorans]WBX84486.1 acyl-CoA/acyl-ACP dehydrogenase [Sphingosinicella microcystinivorans]